MFYRRKVILAIIEAFGGFIEKIALQKLLLLFIKRQLKPDYDFIPYHYGCYSFSANADLTAMVKHGILNEDEKIFAKKDTINYTSKLSVSDKKNLIELHTLYGKMSSTALMKHTYLNHSYYAINSKVAKELLTAEQYQKVYTAKPVSSETILFTIGYEGISLEEYLNKLIKNDVKLLVDVRNNALSMKFGFSKSQLLKYCNSLGIEYMHIPEVGIQSEFRQELNSQADYDSLFNQYKSSTLSKTKSSQEKIFDLLLKKKRIALTCFEANICQCHRKHLSEAITSLPNWDYELKHI
ncbi:MAG: DUF488 domain-containing protein [Chitinophagaceae bacterium]|nr:DUF488 domain-containing protein [Chitinophagaceae bacterium]